jgi:pimeloyl-ACP methyl ester carboxylesterase
MSIFSLRGSPAAPAAVGESRKRWRRVGFAGAAVLLAVVAVIGIVPDLRVRVTAAALLRIPRLLPSTVEQEIGFTHSSDGTRIAYATLGSGPPLVQVLPEGMSHLELGPFSPTYAGRTLERLGSRHLLVRYDGRGFGLSQRGVQHSHEARVADLEAVVRAARLDRFDLWGFSGGTVVAISYTARHPERVRRLVLYGGSAAPTTAFDRETIAAGLTLMRKFWGRDDPAIRKAASDLFVPDASEIEIRIVTELQKLMGAGDDFANAAESLLGVDVSDEAARIRSPTLLIHRRGDLYMPFEHGLALAALIPDSRFVALGGRNHVFLPSDRADSDKMLRAIEDFLEEAEESLATP